ncbi:glycosyltransferase family 2 protein [Micromonospora craniellae]|uniref:Glycosyltransferase family 2 protein n=1 Tax=Micromonospora craniellae TaxID=2294034 RepID=A0A372G6C5_9ACTN|nr:glycosyltransferase family 2 protein [Micromonospora craniellae]QOC90139.1 glycosyltransferase family 2 protein [Micromonospora craniellae]RFS48474.1 glycosyltransferase family 2 protein [Micromonospora craniellae]
MALSIAVVMPTYHRTDLLRRVVPAYLRQEPDELIVVLDGPQPEPRAYLDGLREPRLHVLELPENVGPARARAAGIRHATSEIVFITDDDIVPGEALVDRHRAFHIGRSGAVLAGYIPVADMPRHRCGQVSSRIFAADYERAMRRWDRDPTMVLEGLWGGNVSMERSLYLAAEELREEGRLRYFEDLDLGLRLRAVGATGHFDRDAIGLHLHEKTNASFLQEASTRGAAVRAMEERWQVKPSATHAEDEPAVVARLRRVVAASLRLGFVVPLTVLLLKGALVVAGRLRLWRAEDFVARLLRGILETVAYVRRR